MDKSLSDVVKSAAKGRDVLDNEKVELVIHNSTSPEDTYTIEAPQINENNLVLAPQISEDNLVLIQKRIQCIESGLNDMSKKH